MLIYLLVSLLNRQIQPRVFALKKKIIPEGLITTRAHEQMAGKCDSKSPAFPQIPATPAQLTRLRIFLSEQKFDFVK